MRLKILTVALSLIVSTLSSSDAHSKVVDPQVGTNLASCLADNGYFSWFLIEERTLRSITRDAELLSVTYKELLNAQKEVNRLVEALNESAGKSYELKVRYKEKADELTMLRNPPWYKQYVVWGAVGVSFGVVLAFVGLSVGGFAG